MKLEKILTIGMWVVIGLTLVLMIGLITNISSNQDDAAMNSWLNTNLSWSYILLAAVVAVIVIFGIFQAANDKKAALRALIALVGAAVVIGVSYMLSSNEMPVFLGVERYLEDGTLTLSVSKWIDTGLIISYILFLITIAVTVFYSVKNLVRR